MILSSYFDESTLIRASKVIASEVPLDRDQVGRVINALLNSGFLIRERIPDHEDDVPEVSQ